eukprot:262742_1
MALYEKRNALLLLPHYLTCLRIHLPVSYIHSVYTDAKANAIFVLALYINKLHPYNPLSSIKNTSDKCHMYVIEVDSNNNQMVLNRPSSKQSCKSFRFDYVY